MAETSGSSVHDWRGPVRADYLAMTMRTGVQRPHRTLLRPAGDFVVTRQPVQVVAPSLRHAKGLAPAGRIAIRVSPARRVGKPIDNAPTGGVFDGDAPITGPSIPPKGSVSTSDDDPFVLDDAASTRSNSVAPAPSSAAASDPPATNTAAAVSRPSHPMPARPLPRPSTSRPPRRQVSAGPVPLPPRGVTPARTVRKPDDQVPPSRGDKPADNDVLPLEPPSDVLAAITVTEDGRTLTGRTRSMRRPGPPPQAQPSAPTPAHSSAPRPTPTQTHEDPLAPVETPGQITTADQRAPVEPLPTFATDALSVPGINSDGLQRQPRSTRIRGSAPTPSALAPPASASASSERQQAPAAAPTSTDRFKQPKDLPSDPTQPNAVEASADAAPDLSKDAAPVPPPPAPDSLIPSLSQSRTQSPPPPGTDSSTDASSDTSPRDLYDSATGTTARPPASNTPLPPPAPSTQAPSKPSPKPSNSPAAIQPPASAPAAPQPAEVDSSPSSAPPSSAPPSVTSHQPSTPVLADAPIQRRATSMPRVGDPDTRDDVLDSGEPSAMPPATIATTRSSTSTPTVRPNQAAPSNRSEDSSTSEQSQPDQHTPAFAGSPTTITVPADIRAAIVATTGVSPATASVVRGEAVSKQARDLEADAFTDRGQVHLPGTAPLTSDDQRRLLAHELTHVVQQGNGKRLPPEHTPEGQRLEQKALDVERILATASSHGTPTPDVPRSAPPTPNSPSPMTPPLTSPVGGSTAAGVPVGGSPTKPAPVPGKRVDASSSSDLVRVVATPRSPVPPGRQQPHSSPTAATTPVGQSSSSQAEVAQASRLQPVALPVVTPHNPAAASGNLMASPAPDSSVVQRRRAQAAPSSALVPPTTPPPSATAANPGGMAGHDPQEYRRSPKAGEDTTLDDAWLERHAAALYPIIRRHLRNELLRDRERRGRLVRED